VNTALCGTESWTLNVELHRQISSFYHTTIHGIIGIDKICMMMTTWWRLACNQAIESSYWRMDNDSDACWIMDGLCALPVTGWTGIHGFGYLSPLIWIAPFSAHKLIRQDTAVLHQAIIV
jgi:hypothetical protein